METYKSYPSIYLELVLDLYRDIADCYGICSKTRRIEIRVIRNRWRHEGESFLTKGLPRFGKAIDIAMSRGTPLLIPGWETRPESAIPQFLGWLLERVFGTDGYELPEPEAMAVKHLRQLSYTMYKLEVPYEPETAQAVIDSFVRTEEDITASWQEDHLLFDLWLDRARDLVTRTLSPLDPFGIKPKHGPGAVSTGEGVLEKSFFSRIYRPLERIYPFMEWMRFNLNHVAHSYEADQGNLEVLDRATAKVVLVPKDSRGPRLISCEPLEIQWIQQGLAHAMVRQIELSPYTRGQVNFTSQEVNRRLALKGSLGGTWVTLDMKEASDRVSCKLVERLFAGHPRLLEALMAARSQATLLPNGTVLELSKFAPMGSATCFPVEALCFWALAVSAIAVEQTMRALGYSSDEDRYPLLEYANGAFTKRCIPRSAIRKSVYVYGDDIIVSEKDYVTLMQWLPRVGLMFNADKCCTARFFRESCGCDAYRGVDVTPVRLRTVWCGRRTDPRGLESYVAFSNAMYGLGHYRTAHRAKRLVEALYGLIPYTNSYTTKPNGSVVATTSAPAWVCDGPAHLANRLISGQQATEESVISLRRELIDYQKRATCGVLLETDGIVVVNIDDRAHIEYVGEQALSLLIALRLAYKPADAPDQTPVECVELSNPLKFRFNRKLYRMECYTLASVPKHIVQRDKTLHNATLGYGEMLRRFSAGYGPHGGVYAMVRRNRLKRTWSQV